MPTVLECVRNLERYYTKLCSKVSQVLAVRGAGLSDISGGLTQGEGG